MIYYILPQTSTWIISLKNTSTNRHVESANLIYIALIHVRIAELATLKLFYLYEGHQEKRGKKQKSNKQYKVKKCPVSTLWYFIPNKDEVP